MTQIIHNPDEQKSTPRLFQDRKVDNNGFFDAMEAELPSILSGVEIHKQTRLELQMLFADMKKQSFIKWRTEWTASEQKSFFEKVQSEVIDAGVMASARIREKIQLLIEDEIWREINDDGNKYRLQDGDGNTLISDVGEYQNFLDTSFLLAKETTVIPLDLRLTIGKTETIADAKKKLERYQGKYNALVLVDGKNNPIGVIRAETVIQHDDATVIEKVEVITDAFGYYSTPHDELSESMHGHGINILPIIDSETGVLIGILTGNSLAKKEIQYYSTTSLTGLSLAHLKMNT